MRRFRKGRQLKMLSVWGGTKHHQEWEMAQNQEGPGRGGHSQPNLPTTQLCLVVACSFSCHTLFCYILCTQYYAGWINQLSVTTRHGGSSLYALKSWPGVMLGGGGLVPDWKWLGIDLKEHLNVWVSSMITTNMKSELSLIWYVRNTRRLWSI